jgi:hypothetical protein
MARAVTHQRCPIHSRSVVHTPIAALAFHFERRLTQPPCCQSAINLPKTRCDSSHRCKRGELRAAAQAAISTNTVVGRPGTKMPTTPVANDKPASSISSQRQGAAKGRGATTSPVGCAGGSAGVGVGAPPVASAPLWFEVVSWAGGCGMGGMWRAILDQATTVAEAPPPSPPL